MQKCLGKRSQWIIAVLMMIKLSVYSQNAPPTLPENAPPLIYNFRIDNNQKSRVYFDSSEPVWGSSVNGFKVTGKILTGININSGQTRGHYFSVSKPFTFWDNNTIRYEGGSNIKDDDSNELLEFNLQYIKNNIEEPRGNGQTYYVSTSGNDSNDGLNESSAWRTISHATNEVSAGDIVYIKAGDYGDDRSQVTNSGSVNNPISFIGYKNTPGDNPTLTRSQNTVFSESQMPYIHSRSSSGDGFSTAGSDYIIVRNIQVEGYKNSISFSDSNYSIFDNVYAKGGADYCIDGFDYDAVQNRVINSYAANSPKHGIRISGARHLIDNIYVTSKGEVGMDYYISVYGGDVGLGEHIVRNSTIKRDAADLAHTGHGISLRGNNRAIENCLIENLNIEALGMAIELRSSEVQRCVYRNIYVNNLGLTRGSFYGIQITSAQNNIIENITVLNSEYFIRFLGSTEDPDALDAGNNNLIRNSIFYSSPGNQTKACLYLTEDAANQNRVPNNNTIANCTFYNSKSMYLTASNETGKGNKFVNCIIEGVEQEIYSGSNPHNFSYENSNFYSLTKTDWSSTPKGGINNLNFEPGFVNISNGNFRLKGDSPLINRGKRLNTVNTDFDGNPRPQGSSHDIGAFEYQDNSTSSIRANAGEDQTICKGEELTLTASGGSQYTWSNGETTESIKVSPAETTTYEVTVSDGNTSDKDQVTVSVTQVEANAGQDVTITEGEEVTLTASGGDTYLWNNGETTASITVNPDATTTYTVTVSTNGCEAQDDVKVEVKQQATDSVNANAGEDQTICKGEEVTLTASGGSQYTWSNGETTESIKVSPDETTTYEVTVSDGNTSNKDQVTVSVTQVEANAGQDVTITEGEEVNLTASGGDTYLWNNGETTASITVSPETTTTYVVRVYKNGCEGADDILVTVNAPVNDQIQDEDDAIEEPSADEEASLDEEEELKSLEIIAYPNPTTGILKLESNNSHPELDIHLINSNGQILYQDRTSSENTRFSKQLDMSTYTKGIYFVRFINSYQNEVKKVVLI